MDIHLHIDNLFVYNTPEFVLYYPFFRESMLTMKVKFIQPQHKLE